MIVVIVDHCRRAQRLKMRLLHDTYGQLISFYSFLIDGSLGCNCAICARLRIGMLSYRILHSFGEVDRYYFRCHSGIRPNGRSILPLGE